MTPQCSVIVPTLNEEMHLAKLLTNLQKHRPFSLEIIIVDDGSTDQTINIAEQFGIKLLQRSGNNFGAANRRNQGAKAAKSDILCFLDADTEVLSENFFGICLDHFKNKKIIAVIPGVQIILDTPIEKTVYYKTVFPILSHSPVFFRKSAFFGVGGYPIMGVGEDLMLYKKIKSYAAEFLLSIINEPNAIFSKHDPHSLQEILEQRIWYGKTAIPFMIASRSLRVPMVYLLLSLSLITSLVSLPFAPMAALIIGSPCVIGLVVKTIELIRSHKSYALANFFLNMLLAIAYCWGIFKYLVGFRSLGR